MAIKDNYSNYTEVDYNAAYDLLAPKNHLNPNVIDRNRFDLDPDDTLPQWHNRPDLRHVVSMTFRYQAHQTSNGHSNVRDTLRYGTCETLTNKLMLWGFETFQEFRDHQAVRDKANAKYIWEETACELRDQNCDFLFWIPKGEQHTTEPGCWAITIDQPTKRSVLIWTQGELTLYDGLRHTKQNRVVIQRQ